MFDKYKVRKMGYSRKEIKRMNIDQLVKLGDMGYTKADIDELLNNQQIDTTSLDDKINSLTQQVQSLIMANHVDAKNETVTADNNIMSNKDIDTILKNLALGGTDE